MKKNSEKVVTRTLEIDGKPMTYIGVQSGIELYQDKRHNGNIMYGVKEDKVILTITAESSSEVGHLVDFGMYTVDNEIKAYREDLEGDRF